MYQASATADRWDNRYSVPVLQPQILFGVGLVDGYGKTPDVFQSRISLLQLLAEVLNQNSVFNLEILDVPARVIARRSKIQKSQLHFFFDKCKQYQAMTEMKTL